MTTQKQNSISWTALEFRHYEKSVGWYVTLLAVFALITAFFVLVQKDWFGAICTVLLAGLIVFFSRQQPKAVEITVDSKGVSYGKIFHSYKQLKSFWVVHNQNHKTLNLHTTAHFNNLLILELEEQNPETVREFLTAFLPEHPETEESSIQKVMHWFKF